MSGPAERERRLQALERRLAHVLLAGPDQAELWRIVPRHLSFNELVAGQAALERFNGDPAAALEAGDPVFMALVAAANARRQGVQIPPLASP